VPAAFTNQVVAMVAKVFEQVESLHTAIEISW
jgi:hypothetical protein